MRELKKITKIGNDLIHCNKRCEGISNKPREGILPRCLILETCKRKKTKGSVIVGINPGKSNKREKEYYIENGITYDSIVSYWMKKISGKKYYKWPRILANNLGLVGPILWTEMVKCESKDVAQPMTFRNYPQTFRTCTDSFLCNELELIPSSWPIFALGTVAYSALGFLFPNRTIIGIPHPTGSYGQFNRLIEQINSVNSDLILKEKKLISKHAHATWLSPK